MIASSIEPVSSVRGAKRRPLLVQKFGGTSVGTVDRMHQVARLACESRRAGNDVVVVVSAMSGETDRLLGLAHGILPLPELRELDVVVATGEQVSCALVAMAIQSRGDKACSLLGHQLPLLTDDTFSRARIERIDLDRLRRALSLGEIPVVAGFQGVDAAHNITTLGRGGSDTTAVALAAALEADACEIYTDVEGVFTADPRVAPSGRKLLSIPYEEMLELASLGAKVLQVRSVEIAMKYAVPVHVRSSFSSEQGTWVVRRDQALEAKALTGLSCARQQVRIEMVGVPCRAGLIADLTAALAELDVCADMIAHHGGANGGHTDIAFTVPEAEVRRTQPALERLVGSLGAGEIRVSGSLAKVSLVGIGIRSDPGISAHLCRTLLREGITVSGLAVSELRISCLVDEADADKAVRALHDAFGLAHEGNAPTSH